jgi:pimeloyl-ACP methyl ester carboxylesterase
MEYVTSSDGTPIAFERRGSGPPLVLVHGVAGDHTRWDPVIECLDERFTTFAIDRRGRGVSGDAEEYSFEREVEDIIAVTSSIDAPVSLYGHSFGATASLEAAPGLPNLRRLVLYEPCIPTDPEPIGRIGTLVDEGKPEEALTTFLSDVALMSPEEIDEVRRRPNWPGRVASAHALARELLAENEFQIDRLSFKNMNVPALLLLGEDSIPEAKAATHAVHEALPNSRIHILPDQHHLADFTAPDLVSSVLISFLDEQ